MFRLIRELAADGFPVAVTCRVLRVSRSGSYEWAGRPPSARAVADASLTTTITQVHAASRATYGAPRVHAELRFGLGLACGRKRVARLMRAAGLVGVCHRRKHRRSGPLPARFTQQDSLEVIGDPARGNRYQYAGADPNNNVDPTGQDLLSIWNSILGFSIYTGHYAIDGMLAGAAGGCIATEEIGCFEGAVPGAAFGAIGGYLVGTYEYFAQ